MLQRRNRGPKEGSRQGLGEAGLKEFEAKLASGELLAAVQTQHWLEEAHGIKRPYRTAWDWPQKAGGVLLVPSPCHSRKDSAAAPEFRDKCTAELEAPGIAESSRDRLWMSYEAGFGLHTTLHRRWAPRAAAR